MYILFFDNERIFVIYGLISVFILFSESVIITMKAHEKELIE